MPAPEKGATYRAVERDGLWHEVARWETAGKHGVYFLTVCNIRSHYARGEWADTKERRATCLWCVCAREQWV